jgi:hypothetical protein
VNPVDRMQNVMLLLADSDLDQLAQLAAGDLMMVEDEDGSCWWCPADVESHSGKVLYDSSSFLDEFERQLVTSEFLSANKNTPFLVPMLAHAALAEIIKDQNNTLMEAAPRIFREFLNETIGQLIA